MPAYEYEDFHLGFKPRGEREYEVVARDEAGAEAVGAFTVPLSDVELRSAVTRLGRTRDVGVGERGAQHVTARDLGTRLADALFSGPVGGLYDAALRRAERARHGLRLRLSLAATPELLDVPWEFLYRRPTFIASQQRTPIVRYLEIGSVEPPHQIDEQVRILAVVASPTDLPGLDVSAERARLERALHSVLLGGQAHLDWLDPATPRRLRETLRDGSYHVLHFIGHSDYRDGDSVLILENDQHNSAPVSDIVLANLLADQRSLRLAVLNSCRGARTSLTDPFAGIATSLVALGVTAVVAMQFAITDDAAIAFADEFYTSLIGRQLPIDAAMAEARKAILTDINEIEWATPVLFLRTSHGQLFDFTPTARPPLEDRDRDLSEVDTRFAVSEAAPVREDVHGPIVISPDGRYMAAPSPEWGMARVWEMITSQDAYSVKHRVSFFADDRSVCALAFSPVGHYLVTVAHDLARLWEHPGGREVLSVKHQGVRTVVFSPDGRYLVTGGQSAGARVWELPEGREVLHLRHSRDWVASISFHPDGRSLVTAEGGTVQLWEFPSGREITSITVGSRWQAVAQVIFSPNGQQIVTACKSAQLWEVPSGRELLSVGREGGWGDKINALAISPDGHHLVTAGVSNPCVWQLPTGRQIGQVPHEAADHVAYTADGRYLVTSGGGEARVWKIATRPDT